MDQTYTLLSAKHPLCQSFSPSILYVCKDSSSVLVRRNKTQTYVLTQKPQKSKYQGNRFQAG